MKSQSKTAHGKLYAQCGELLRAVLARDSWTLSEDKPPAAFVAQRNSRRITFFFSNQPVRGLTNALKKIQRADRGQFKQLSVIIAPTTKETRRLRNSKLADKFPRAFFTSVEELREIASGNCCAPLRPTTGTALSFNAEVLANTPVGGAPSQHYRLAFKADGLEEVHPPQFIMMDTAPQRLPFGSRAVPGRKTVGDFVDLTPRPLLKRPFGVYRAFRRHFARDFLKRLELPPALAPALHLCFPDHFDMLYKVLPDGLGTNLMTKLKRGHKVHMVGPLGQPFDVRCLRAQGIEEVHVIGGGVGMAPLVLLVETLRYYAMPVKIFLGIATLESLRYRDELAATFGEKPRDAYIYIDDLLAAGVRPTDIYVSCDREAPEKVIRGIPEANLFHGLVPDQYRKFLAAHHLSVCHPERSEGSQSARAEDEILRSAQDDRQRELGVIMAFTCGPNRMMEIVSEICQAAGVRLKVLLEKRMGCGIGVCFSCVQKIRRPDGHDDYARICVEGPLFDAKDILWKNNDDSKQPSATSNCTARC